MWLRNLAGCGLAALLLAPAAAPAAPKPAALPVVSDVSPAKGACSFGTHLDISGYCVDSMDYARICPPRFFAISFPNGNGFRCLPVEWQRAYGWFGDFFD